VTADGYPKPSYAWTVAAILFATAILSYTDRQVLSLLVDPIRGELGISDAQVALLQGPAFALVYGCAGILLGYLADRVSRRNLILAGVLVWSLGTLCCGLARSFPELFGARIVVGLGEAVLSPAAISMISDYFPPSRRGTAVGFFLSGIAMGIGAAIFIGGGVLHFVQLGIFSGTALAGLSAWRLVFLLIGAPGLLWAALIGVIREPVRRAADAPTPEGIHARAGAARPAGAALPHPNSVSTLWMRVIPVYLVVAAASLVDNAVGAWAPSLLIRQFSRDAAQIGLQLGLLLTAGFGGGVLIGGWLADRAGVRGGWVGKLLVCLGASLLIFPVALSVDSGRFEAVMLAVATYFALSGCVTACGFSAILDVVPNRSRGLAMAISFFLNVALGAGLGPNAVTFASERVFGSQGGLGPAISLTVACGYALAVAALLIALSSCRKARTAVHSLD